MTQKYKRTFLMASIFSLSFFSTTLAASMHVTSFDNGTRNQIIPNIHLKNNGKEITGFKVHYYFSATDSQDIEIIPYYTKGSTASIEKISDNQYRATLDFSRLTLNKNNEFPNNGNLQFGIHYADWSSWRSKSEVFSSKKTSLNDHIVVESLNGEILAGKIPNKEEFILKEQKIRTYIKSSNSANYGKYHIYAKNEGKTHLTEFEFDIEFTKEKNGTPIIEKWNIPNTSITLENKENNVCVLHFNVKDVHLPPGAVFPDSSGLYFGIHYSNWEKFDITNDYSLANVKSNFNPNDNITSTVDEDVSFGNPKIHDLSDMKKILAKKSGYTLDNFNTSVKEIYKNKKNSITNWTALSSIENVIIGGIPNFEEPSEARKDILKNFPGMDENFLAANYKKIKEIYAQWIRLRLSDYLQNKQNIPSDDENSVYLQNNQKTPAYLKKAEADYEFGDTELTEDEFWALALNPMRYPGSKRAYQYAEEWANEYANDRGLKGSNPNKATDNRADAFRHAVYNALLCRETGTQYDDINDCLDWAEEFATAHEQHSDKNAYDTQMDLHNNEISRLFYKSKLKIGCEWNIGTCINEEVIGPSREETKQMYRDLADKANRFNDKDQLDKMPWQFSLVYFRNDDGKYFCPTKTSNCIKYEPPLNGPKRVGLLLKSGSSCNSEKIKIRLDTEDDNNATGIKSGTGTPPGIKISDGGITFTYCAKEFDGEKNKLPRISYDYIVLRLDDMCPEGSYPFRRHHDTEDSDPNNWSEGNIWPNVVGTNADLEYCFIPKDKNSSKKFPFSDKYGIFASQSTTSKYQQYKIKIDDEDSGNANSWKWYDTSKDYQKRIKEIIEGGDNTVYKVLKIIEITLATIFNKDIA